MRVVPISQKGSGPPLTPPLEPAPPLPQTPPLPLHSPLFFPLLPPQTGSGTGSRGDLGWGGGARGEWRGDDRMRGWGDGGDGGGRRWWDYLGFLGGSFLGLLPVRPKIIPPWGDDLL